MCLIEDKKALLNQIKHFNEKYMIERYKYRLVARICGDYVFIDRNDNGIVSFYCRLAYSVNHDRWDIHILSDEDSCFQHVPTDHLGSNLIDGTLEGAFKFCDFSVGYEL